MEYIISHDFGTSSVKSSLFSTFGTLIKSVSTPLKTMSDKPGYAVQDARDWWRIFCANNKALLIQSAARPCFMRLLQHRISKLSSCR